MHQRLWDYNFTGDPQRHRLVCIRQGKTYRRVPYYDALFGVILRGWVFTTKSAYRAARKRRAPLEKRIIAHGRQLGRKSE